MSVTTPRTSWSARLLIGLVLIILGAAAATWALARYAPAAEFLGVVQPEAQPATPQQMMTPTTAVPAMPPVTDVRVATLEARLARVESEAQQARGSAGRADALVVAFAARRAVDRGVALGYLENLLVERFGPRNQAAVGTVIAASHKPIRLNDLIAEYETLGPDLRRGGPQDSWWTNFKRELGTLIEVHRADEPSANADARYNRALQRLTAGDVDQALAETMRLPGATRAQSWIEKARRYVAAHRALDEIESAALLGGGATAP